MGIAAFGPSPNGRFGKLESAPNLVARGALTGAKIDGIGCEAAIPGRSLSASAFAGAVVRTSSGFEIDIRSDNDACSAGRLDVAAGTFGG